MLQGRKTSAGRKADAGLRGQNIERPRRYIFVHQYPHQGEILPSEADWAVSMAPPEESRKAGVIGLRRRGRTRLKANPIAAAILAPAECRFNPTGKRFKFKLTATADEIQWQTYGDGVRPQLLPPCFFGADDDPY
jgi:hypothetical protein